MSDSVVAAEDSTARCGYVAIVGRPNVGKSTLLNRLIGQKLSITSRRPQTTRHQVLGIATDGNVQAIYVDTPGMHRAANRAINRYMNRAAFSSLEGVDVVIFVVEGLKWTDDDALVLERLAGATAPVLLVVNKIDEMADKQKLLPHLQWLAQQFAFAEIVPLSARGGHNVDTLAKLVAARLPRQEHVFGPDELTDRSLRFLAAELIREKVMRQIGDEIPYQLAVEVESFKEEGNLYHIHAAILVEKDGQKAIVIGRAGERLKKIGSQARQDMEKLFGCKVMLELWVKVRGGWADDERALKSLGYD
ncbi:MAG: GTPase Era [Gammaproteobacteria bacterium]